MKKHILFQLIVLCLFTYLLGIFCVPLMDIDATQYASISREMLLRGHYLQLYDLGNDYLDKPPMLFWLSSCSMYIFGIHDWAYRLPSLLFSLLAIYSTYRLALLFYKKEIALLSALVLASCQAMFLINHDVRTDTMLMGWVACSIWQLAAWYQYNKWKNILIAAIAIAGGMMTKGPIALMIPIFSFVPHFILQRNWKAFAQWQYIPLLLIIALLLVPMSIGLYQQYDMHPGKIIGGKKINSGLVFYYWTQSFGRIAGGNNVKENASIFFLFQNMLWSFLPWILLLTLGIVSAIKNLLQAKFLLSGKGEGITLGGFIITYFALGSSQVQLPHYIFVVFPFAGIITANFLYGLLFINKWRNRKRPLLIVHMIVCILLWLALLLLLFIPFKNIPFYVFIIACGCFAFFILLLFAKNLALPKLLTITVFTSIGINIFLNTVVYPSLLHYQTGNIAARFINDNNLPKQNVYIFGDVVDARNSIYFYGDYFFKKIINANELLPGNYVLTSQKDYDELIKNKPATIVFTGKGFPVSKLNLKFLNPATRESELLPFYIVKVN
jgi:4-amino-4-deoxy-L-arabinose transferase-like glycosyltransferase